MVLLTVVFVVWGLIVSMIVPFAQGAAQTLTTIVVAWAPIGLLVWFLSARNNRRQALHSEMLASLGVAPGSGNDHAEDGSGIAVNRSKKMVALLSDGAYRAYGYEQIREWSIRHERAGRVVAGFGVANGMTAIGANAKMERDARANTGLFLTVRDLDRPGWRVSMKNAKTRERWMELLRQEINEGGAVAAG